MAEHREQSPEFLEAKASGTAENLSRAALDVIACLHDAEARKSAVTLYAHDPENTKLFNRTQGDGLLRLAEIGKTLQIRKGRNWLLASEQPEYPRLQLDAQSVAEIQTYRVRRDNFRAQRYISPPRGTRGETGVDADAFHGIINEREAKKFGLERVELSAYPKAQALIEAVRSGMIDISAPLGKERFCRAWVGANPDLPLPCTPPKELWEELYPDVSRPSHMGKQANFGYLARLAEYRIFAGRSAVPPLIPDFGRPSTIYAETWPENNEPSYNRAQFASPILKNLLGDAFTVIARTRIDHALWEGDPANRVPTNKHKAILKRLGLDDRKYMIRLITHDEYARAAQKRGWGQHGTSTNFDGYMDGYEGLLGGRAEFGGASDINWVVGDMVCGGIRLVVVRR